MLPRFTLLLSSLVVFTARIHAQDLSPRAYVITPIHTNAVILTRAFYDGSVDLNGTVPVSNATGIKVNYSNGTYIRFGGNNQNFAVAWQYQWSGRPR